MVIIASNAGRSHLLCNRLLKKFAEYVHRITLSLGVVASLTVLGVGDGEKDRQHTDGTGHRDNHLRHRPRRDKPHRGECHHGRHHAYGTGLLGLRHTATTLIATHIPTHPRPQQPRLEARRTAQEQPRRQQQERRRRQPRHHHPQRAQRHRRQPQRHIDRPLHFHCSNC